MARLIHPIAGTVAFVTIATFWLSTVLVELLGGPGAVTTLKTAIPWGFLLLIPAIAATGGSGLNLSKGRRRGVIGAKLKRMPIIAANGLAVLIPSAFFLASKARAGQFDAAFYAVQALELVAGATNLTLLGLSMRDGLALTAWRRNGVPRPIRCCRPVSCRRGTWPLERWRSPSRDRPGYTLLGWAGGVSDPGQDVEHRRGGASRTVLHCQRPARVRPDDRD